MPVTRSCSPGDLAVALNATAGEYLVYRVVAEVADVEYSLVTESGAVLADKASCPSPCVRKWPASPGEIPSDGDEQHTLAMQFVSEGEQPVTRRITPRAYRSGFCIARPRQYENPQSV